MFTSLKRVKGDKQDQERGKGKACLFTLYFLKNFRKLLPTLLHMHRAVVSVL